MTDALSSLKTSDLVKVYNAATGGSVKRFATQAVGLKRTRAAVEQAGLAVDQAIRVAGLDMPFAVEDAPPEAAASVSSVGGTAVEDDEADCQPGYHRDAYGFLHRDAPLQQPKRRAARADTKAAQLLALLRRTEGATRLEMQAEMGWKQPPTKYHKDVTAKAGLRFEKITREDGTKAFRAI